MRPRTESEDDHAVMNVEYLIMLHHVFTSSACSTIQRSHWLQTKGETQMSNTQVSISTQDTPQYPLSYSAIQLQDGFYEPKGRKDVVLFVTQANPTTGLRTVLRFSNDGKNLAYPANGWNGYSFRRINASINLSA